jgi:hypothetical protein
MDRRESVFPQVLAIEADPQARIAHGGHLAYRQAGFEVGAGLAGTRLVWADQAA